MYEVLAGGTEHRLDLHGDSFEAAVRGLLKEGKSQNFAVQVHRNVALHLLREVLHHLGKNDKVEIKF